jgi:hypothetical protein
MASSEKERPEEVDLGTPAVDSNGKAAETTISEIASTWYPILVRQQKPLFLRSPALDILF